MGRPRIKQRYRIDPITGCWVWLLSRKQNGYGNTYADGRIKVAHRAMYEQVVGPIPDGMELDHLCRNRACVNPAHLEPVTKTVNCQRGLKARLKPTEVLALRADAKAGLSYTQLAAKYGLSRNSIGNIVRRETWRNLNHQEN